MRREIIGFFFIKQIKEPRLYSVLLYKHLHVGSGRALEKWGETLDYVLCFPLHFFRALPLPACFTTEQSTDKASLFVKYSGTDLRAALRKHRLNLEIAKKSNFSKLAQNEVLRALVTKILF